MTEPRVSTQQRQEVGVRARGCCEYCRGQVQFAMRPFSVDHIVPRSRGGVTAMANLALACSGCNAHKYNKVQGIDPINDTAVISVDGRCLVG